MNDDFVDDKELEENRVALSEGKARAIASLERGILSGNPKSIETALGMLSSFVHWEKETLDLQKKRRGDSNT